MSNVFLSFEFLKRLKSELGKVGVNGLLNAEQEQFLQTLLDREVEKLNAPQITLSCPICEYREFQDRSPLSKEEFENYPEWTPFWSAWEENWVFFVTTSRGRMLFELCELVNAYTCYTDACSQIHNCDPEFHPNVFYRTDNSGNRKG